MINSINSLRSFVASAPVESAPAADQFDAGRTSSRSNRASQQYPATGSKAAPAAPVQQYPAKAAPVQQVPAAPVQQVPAAPVQQVPAAPTKFGK